MLDYSNPVPVELLVRWKNLLGICLVAVAPTALRVDAQGSSAQGIPPFQFLEKPGPHAVGLKVVEQYDYSRTFRPPTDALGKPSLEERARPLQTLVWYPADKTGSKPMTVEDYLNLLPTETSFGKPRKNAIEDSQRSMAPVLKTPLWAVRDAHPAVGHFPVVIYTPSYSATAWENADLCEYLASHGYVVLASPNMGASTRGMTSDLAGISAQARDASFLIGFAQTLPDTDMSAVAVGGFSWGGISNLFAAARDNRIDALFALDGSMRYFPGLVKQSGDVHPEQMTLPLLFIAQGEISLEEAARFFSGPAQAGPSVLNEWTHGDLMTVEMLGMIHGENSSMKQRSEDFWKNFPEQQKADYGREDGAAGYAWEARYTLQFLNAYLKHDPGAMAFLKKTPAQNGAPKHFITAKFRAASGAPASLEGFRAEVARQGFDHAAKIYESMKKQNPDLKLDELVLSEWGETLTADAHLPEAIELLKLNVQLHPDSGYAYDALGDAYSKAGEKQLAIENYRKSLEKDPDLPNVKEKLKLLESNAPPAK